MCVRTKTSYGCGCEYKTTNKCYSSRCRGLEKYHYPREGDCRPCKQGGEAVTRGREGKGRYAQEISRRSQPREPLTEIPDNTAPFALDMGGGISPWASPLKREKEWHSPSRRKADEAWLQEHGERNSDLQTIRDSITDSDISDNASTARYSSGHRDDRISKHEDDHHYNRDDDHDHQRRGEGKDRTLQIEIRSIHDYERRSPRPVHHRQRHDSQESFESMHSGRSSSRKYKPAPTTYTTNDYFEPHDSGYGSYGSYGSRTSYGYEVAKSEPYLYSPSPRVLTTKPPSTSHGVYQTGFGVGGVEIRTPMYGYGSRRH